MDLEAFSPCLGKARALDTRILGSKILFLSLNMSVSRPALKEIGVYPP